MRAALDKLMNNVLAVQAPSVLGARAYLQYLGLFVALLPRIVRSRGLVSLDRAMSGKVSEFNYRGSVVRFDTRFCDRQIDDGTFAFGSVRELYIRDCYFRHLPPGTYETAKVVVDLGANRGAFSSLVAPRVQSLLAVEASAEFRPVIEHNLALNQAVGSVVEIGFVGDGGKLDPDGLRRFTLDDLLAAHGITTIDVIKIDIEGSEYALFAEPARWLELVRAVTMEVHPRHGDTADIIATLKRRGFAVVMADDNLRRVSQPREADFVYAWRYA